MNSIEANKRGLLCMSQAKCICFISLKELEDEDVRFKWNEDAGMEVPIHKRFIGE